MSEKWPTEWLRSRPEQFHETNTPTPGLSCVFVLVDQYTRAGVRALKKKFQGQRSVTIHSIVMFPGELITQEEYWTHKEKIYNRVCIMQVDFFISSCHVVFKTEKTSSGGTYWPEERHLEIRSIHGEALWKFPLQCIHQSYTVWI